MAFRDTDEQRKEIFDKLIAYCQQKYNKREDNSKISEEIAEYFTKIRTGYKSRDVPASDLLYRLYYEPGEKPYYLRARYGKMKGLYLFLVYKGMIFDEDESGSTIEDDVFRAMCDFWRVRDNNIAKCRDDISGTYRFYARSEDHEDCLVLGALRFDFNQKSGAVTATELQREHPFTESLESWSGYVLMRRDRIVIAMSAGGGFKTPKFYFLNPHYQHGEADVPDGSISSTMGNGAATYLDGFVAKLGKSTAFFLSGVYMIRDKDAFEKARMIPLSTPPDDLPPEVLSKTSSWGRTEVSKKA